MITAKSPRINELKQALETREQNLKDDQEAEKKLKARRAEIEANMNGLEQSVSEAMGEKEKCLDAYVRDESETNEGALKKADEVLTMAKKSQTDAQDMLRAIDRALNKYQTEIPQLVQAIGGATHKFWFAVSEELGAVAKANVSLPIEQAWAARARAGGSNYDQFLRSIFPQPSIERLNQLKTEMDSQE